MSDTSERGGERPNEYVAPATLRALAERGAPPTFVDVRDAEEYAAGHVPGALHIPLDDLPGRLGELPPGRPVVTY